MSSSVGWEVGQGWPRPPTALTHRAVERLCSGSAAAVFLNSCTDAVYDVSLRVARPVAFRLGFQLVSLGHGRRRVRGLWGPNTTRVTYL